MTLASLGMMERGDGVAFREGEKMTALFVALSALYLGAWGPRFLWRGAAMLVAIMIGTGLIATWAAARDAQVAGLIFQITPTSALLGLGEQAIFAFGFYSLSALARWAHLGLTGNDGERLTDTHRDRV
jgi:hypothetical protein